MKLYETIEKAGARRGLDADKYGGHHPEGVWELVGPVSIERGDKPYKGVDSDVILDAIDRKGVFIWPNIGA